MLFIGSITKPRHNGGCLLAGGRALRLSHHRTVNYPPGRRNDGEAKTSPFFWRIFTEARKGNEGHKELNRGIRQIRGTGRNSRSASPFARIFNFRRARTFVRYLIFYTVTLPLLQARISENERLNLRGSPANFTS